MENSDLKEMHSAEIFNKLKNRVYYDLNYLKFLKKLKINLKIQELFKSHLVSQINSFLSDGNIEDKHKNELKTLIAEEGKKELFVENKSEHCRYYFIFKTKENFLCYFTKAEDLKAAAPCEKSEVVFSNLSFFVRHIKNDAKVPEIFIYTFNFNIKDVSFVKSRVESDVIKLYNKKMDMRIEAGQAISFDEF